MKRFTLLQDTCTIGFQTHVALNPNLPACSQLNRRELKHRQGGATGNPAAIKKIIEFNSSLRIGFGWSFESATVLKNIVDECISTVAISFNDSVGTLITDNRVDWIGFSPFNIFEKSILDDMPLYSLIVFNNELVAFQHAVIDYIREHNDYRYHAFMRDNNYRYLYMKSIRKDPALLVDAFHYYIQAVKATTGIVSIPRLFVDEMIGCHYLRHPDIFFELLEFYILKGVLYDE